MAAAEGLICEHPRNERKPMCRNIKTLFNFAPPANEDEIRAASLQFVRKLSGFTRPSSVNQQAFDSAIDAVTAVSQELLASLETSAKPRNREVEAARALERVARRFGSAKPESASRPSADADSS